MLKCTCRHSVTRVSPGGSGLKHSRLIFLIAVLTLTLLAELLLLQHPLTQAEDVYPVEGIVTADPSCNMRQDPNTSREVLRELRKDVKLTVLGETEGEDVGGNTSWYEIQYGEIHGYVSSVFVRLQYEVPMVPAYPEIPLPGAAEFRQALADSGFPADYVAKLMELHAAHPYWRFTPLHTNYSFATAVNGENRPGVNMVTATAPPEYKSREDSDFNYVTNSWYEYEPGWVGASKELIAFQMDPRNFLDEIQIFQFESQRYNADLPYEKGLAQTFSGTFMDAGEVRYITTDGDSAFLRKSYAEIFREAGESSGVSPYHLASRALQELGRNGSDSVSGQYADLTGYYNFFNIGAYGGSDPVYAGLLAARDGLEGYSSAQLANFLFPWTDPERAIVGGAAFIGNDYIKVDQHTLYLQKWNLASRYSRAFTHQYMGNVLAPEYEAIDVYKSYQQMGTLDEVKDFVIPVFADMPDYVPEPTNAGNPNNWLAMIYINGEPLPDFRAGKYEYKLDIAAANQGIAVTASTFDPGTSVAGTGIYQLHSGINEILLNVTASSGYSRQYRLSVSQDQATAGRDPYSTKVGKTGNYALDSLGYLYGADPLDGSNNVDRILAAIELPEGYRTSLSDGNGNLLTGSAGTGALFRVEKEGSVYNSFPLVILGDANGDGAIDVQDLNTIYAAITGNAAPSGTASALAMDANQDRSTDVLDLNAIYAQITGAGQIVQKPAY